VIQLLRKPLAAILMALFLPWCFAPAFAGVNKTEQALLSPPDQYLRRVVIEVHDPSGKPVKGIKAEVSSILGRLLVEESEFISDPHGQIRFQIQPVIEEPMAGHMVQDRFLFYRSAFKYRLTKPDFISQQGEIKDVQEFAAFQDLLYRVLDREPTQEPLIVPVTLYAYQGYLSSAQNAFAWSKSDHQRFKDLVDTLKKNGQKHDFTLPLASIAFPSGPEAVFKLRLIFDPHFDPTEMGLLSAGVVLFRGPFLTALSALKSYLTPADRIKTIRIAILAHFQSRSDPRARSIAQVFVFRLPMTHVPLILNKGNTPPFPLESLEIKVNGQTLNLSQELNRVARERSSGNPS